MKWFSFSIRTIASLFMLALNFGLSPVQAQESDKEKKQADEEVVIRNLVENQRYMFVAQSATPMSGRTRQLTGSFDLQVKSDTLLAYLPYYGQSYSADYGSTNNGIDFKTNQFDYVKKDAKKGGWNITITPKNIRSVRQITMLIGATGFTSVQVTSNTRQTISFNGYIRELRQ